jgi:hypothetical protein
LSYSESREVQLIMVNDKKCFRDNSYALRYVSLLLLLQKERFNSFSLCIGFLCHA